MFWSAKQIVGDIHPKTVFELQVNCAVTIAKTTSKGTRLSKPSVKIHADEKNYSHLPDCLWVNIHNQEIIFYQ